MTATVHKAEKYALDGKHLDDATRTFLMKNFGCSRKVYNLYVDFLYASLEESGYAGGGPLPEVKLPEVSSFKESYPYLKEADSLGLANAKLRFQNAMRRYVNEYDHVSHTKRALRRAESGTEPLTFRGLKGMPKFHAKARGDFSYTTNCQYPKEGNGLKNPTVRLVGNILYVPRLRNGVRLVLHRPLPADARIGNVTFSMDIDGRFYAAVEYSCQADINMNLRESVLAGDTSVPDGLSFPGLDYSQKDFYVDSEGRKANCPRSYGKSVAKLAGLQRELSRMEKGSANYNRKLAKIRKLHVKIRNRRKDFVCREAAFLASAYDVIAVEDIDLRSMAQALSLGRNLHDNGFGMFRTRLSQKLEEKGSMLVRVDRSFASTKTCSCCGYQNKDITLATREWDCPACGAHHDRDVNAAVNICREGKRIFPERYAEWMEEDRKARKRAEERSDARRRKRSA